MKKKILFFTLVITIFISCNQKFSNQNLNGKIENNDWDCKTAFTTTNPSDSSQMEIIFYNQELEEPCNNTVSDDFISISCPAKVGVHKFDKNNLQAFFYSKQNTKIAFEGIIEIMSIDTGEKINGRINAKIDAKNYISGVFEADFCQNKNLYNFMNEMENTIDTLMKN